MFTAPALAGAGVAAVSVPIAIHLLWRLRRRSRPWGAMRFLQAAYRRHRQRLRFEQLVLLMVRCLILAVLGLALAGPMVGGAAAQWLAGLDAGERTVHIVIDDALPSRALAPTDERRFKHLRGQVLAVVDAMAPGDRAALWRSARPAGPVIAEPTDDRAALRRAIEGLRPRYSRTDTSSALRRVEAALSESQASAERVSVILLDSFSEASAFLEEPVPTTLSDLGERVSLWALPPAGDAANIQVQSLSPQRHMVLASGERVEVPVRVTLGRFDRDLAPAEVPLTVSLSDAEGRLLGQVQRNHRFADGERSSTVNFTLTTTPGELELGRGGRLAVIEARLAEGGSKNRLAADDRRLAVVEVRSHLEVGLVDEPGSMGPDEEGLRPGQWLALALDPDGRGRAGMVRLRQVSPVDASAEVPEELDAVMVLRPDLLTSDGWRRLADYVSQGGLAWVFVPPVDAPAGWTRDLVEVFEVADWTVGLEVVEATEEREATLDGEASAPERLALLASDWSALVDPIRVMRRLPMSVPADSAWLRMTVSAEAEDGAWEAEDGGGGGVEALLAREEFGSGVLLLQGTALDAQWTNLPTRPMFVPLMHESLRGVLGAARDRIEPGVVAGDEPTFGPAWRDARHLRWHEEWAESGMEEVSPIALEGAEAGAGVAEPIEVPGIYGSEGGLMVAVNVEAEAGDTRGVSEQRVRTWLGRLGGGRLWEQESDLAALFERDAVRVNVGWPLLWLVAALVLLETLLARWFSHAQEPTSGGSGSALSERVRGMIRSLRPGAGLGAERSESAQRERAA